jgi:hypothetical protein
MQNPSVLPATSCKDAVDPDDSRLLLAAAMTGIALPLRCCCLAAVNSAAAGGPPEASCKQQAVAQSQSFDELWFIVPCFQEWFLD